ncbi:MAG: methyltransferase domain-containing protein [Polyangiaceae bacterium]|nr:methyltransferase domain-containing protein [Polyangiaceae bacterium]
MSSRDARVGWSGAAYEAVSAPQHAWGKRVLERLSLDGPARVLDLGCGSGRVTRELLTRFPSASVTGVDVSPSMVEAARAALLPEFDARLSLRVGDALSLGLRDLDAIVSTATFHWITDHASLFGELIRALRPGGRLVAQCGGEGNLDRLYGRARELDGAPAFAPWLATYVPPHLFASVADTRARLSDAGFVDVEVWLSPEPTPFASRGAFVEFVRNVVVRHELAALPDEPARAAYVDALADAAASDVPPWELDYVRLNLDARRPA